MSNPQSRGELKFASSLYKTISRLLKFFTARIPGGRVLNFPSAQAFGKYEQFFSTDAIAHPAKANSAMIEWIILRYTKPGETIVDPMAGTFSTSVIAAINNRHGIGVELEEKFYKWGLEAKRRVEQIPTLTPKGRMVVLKGDARELSKVLKENADAVVFSPPFASEQFGLKDKDRREYFAKASPGRKFPGPSRLVRDELYQEGKGNIANLPYGASAIIFSPPFATEQTNEKGAAGGGTPTYQKKYGYATHYEADGNIADLPYAGGGN